ncbi:Ankyrin repeat-containing protein [Mizuhopecten yessoensis]|uniref:Ankyrin repeat-containing protein n=1 Tax=Mizuhopecten yessoensis TaxID=6573 RepID=A0A210QFP1_MIZYE|nr:Ankyrin repeat-containing protein [Mizuhopecten yessoensis]
MFQVCTEKSEMASVIPTEAIDIHNDLVFYLGTQIEETKLCQLKNLLKNNPLTPVDIASIKNIYDLFDNLMRYKTIAVGDYTQFVRKLELTNPDLVGYVNEKENAIKSIVDGDPATRIATTSDTSRDKKIHPDLEPMIERTKAKIITEKRDNKFHPTKGFCDAKEKLLNNRVVVIKGNTGDGKTAIAVQLLHWLSEEQKAGQPLQLHEIKKLDLLAPNLKLITFIDDIFGEKDVCKTDVDEWNKRILDVKTLFVDKQAQTNFLIITIRNEVFNSLEKRSLGTILTEDNIIDLSSQTYKLAEEKKELLELYKPKNFSWTDEEKTQISTYAPNIGFPQCCKLFYNSEELQKERVNFFENPFHFLNEALLRLQECSALLYLFLNGGMIRVQDLDPNSENVNKILLEQAFSIKLIGGKNHTATPFCNKIRKMGFIKDSFDELLGFLVKKEKFWSIDHEDVYRFNHHSIYVAVALLYGKVTPIGYIQNCPSQSLSYLTTSKTATNMIVIASDQYTKMCERLLREFECKEYPYDTCIGSLDVWNDPVFVKRFVRLLNDRKVDELAVLNKACHCGAKECVLYLLSKGVKPDKDTALSLVTSRHWIDSNRQVCLLRKIGVYLNDESKVDVLNEACDSRAEECALYLLCEGVEPDEEAVISVVEGQSVKLLRKLLEYDVTPTARNTYNENVLHVACWRVREEMVTLLQDKYPHLVHDTDRLGRTPLHVVARSGNFSRFQTLERCVLNSLYRVDDQQHKCESVNGRVVHRNCVCAQYMAQLVDNNGGTVLHYSCGGSGQREIYLYLCQSYPALTTVVDNAGSTVLHYSCWGGNRKVCSDLCRLCPALTTAVDNDGRHCLHYLAREPTDVERFTECESHVKQYLESTGRKYDITTILNNKGESVLDLAKRRASFWAKYRPWRTENNPLLDHLIKVFGK